MGRLAALLIAFVTALASFAPAPAHAHAGHGQPPSSVSPPAGSAMPAGQREGAVSTSRAAALDPRNVVVAPGIPNAAAPTGCPGDDGTPCSCHVDALPLTSDAWLVAACGANATFILPHLPERSIAERHPIAVPSSRDGSVSARGPPVLEQHAASLIC